MAQLFLTTPLFAPEKTGAPPPRATWAASYLSQVRRRLSSRQLDAEGGAGWDCYTEVCKQWPVILAVLFHLFHL